MIAVTDIAKAERLAAGIPTYANRLLGVWSLVN